MKLPNGEKAIVSDGKLYGYLLHPYHDVGKHHAALFKKLLGIDRSNAEVLRDALLQATKTQEASEGQTSPYGSKYEVRFQMAGADWDGLYCVEYLAD